MNSNPELPPPQFEAPGRFIGRYFSDVLKILTHPTLFFKQMPITGGIGGPLCFALVTHWIGSAAGFIWHLAVGEKVSRHFQSFFQSTGRFSGIDSPAREAQLNQIKDRILDWFFGAGPVILDPFFTLFSILFTSFLVFVGARILVAPGKNDHPDEITYESAVKIICFGMTPAILTALPLIGGFAAHLGTLIVTVIGAKVVYQISTGRALIIALFPKLLFLGILLIGLLSFVVFIVKLVVSII